MGSSDDEKLRFVRVRRGLLLRRRRLVDLSGRRVSSCSSLSGEHLLVRKRKRSNRLPPVEHITCTGEHSEDATEKLCWRNKEKILAPKFVLLNQKQRIKRRRRRRRRLRRKTGNLRDLPVPSVSLLFIQRPTHLSVKISNVHTKE